MTVNYVNNFQVLDILIYVICTITIFGLLVIKFSTFMIYGNLNEQFLMQI